MRPASRQKWRLKARTRNIDAYNEMLSKMPSIKGPGRTKEQSLDYNSQSAEKSSSKRKREQETEETPQSSKKKGIDGSLVGARIKVWWGSDKCFYKGIVDSYDSASKRHKVKYDDGDVEVLLLRSEKWEFINKDNYTLKKFDKKSFPHNCSMEKIHEGCIATSDLNFTSTEEPRRFPPSRTEHDNLDDPCVGVNPSYANVEGQGQRQSNGPINKDEHTTSCCSGQKGEGSGEIRKESQVVGVEQEHVDFRKKQTRICEDDLDRKTKLTDDYSIKNCLAVLESTEELSDVEKAKAIRIFKCDQNREIFLNLKNPTVRLLWIKGEIAP